MRKFQCLLFVLKRLYNCHYIICMTVPLKSNLMENLKFLITVDVTIPVTV